MKKHTTVGVVFVTTEVNCTFTTALAIVLVEATEGFDNSVSFWPLDVNTVTCRE